MTSKPHSSDYASSGVDIDAGNEVVRRIKALARSTFTPGVLSVGVGDRMVVHDSDSGRIFALDPGGARVWQQLAGWSDGIDVGGPVIQPFVERLRALGVLAGAA